MKMKRASRRGVRNPAAVAPAQAHAIEAPALDQAPAEVVLPPNGALAHIQAPGALGLPPDGLLPLAPGSHLPPSGPEFMPRGVLGFVFSFPDGLVNRTTARVIQVSGAIGVFGPNGNRIGFHDAHHIFVNGGLVLLGLGGDARVPGYLDKIEAPLGCVITVPIGGEIEFARYPLK